MATKKSRKDCVIHRRGAIVWTQAWLQDRMNRGVHTFDGAVTITRPLVFRRGSGRLYRLIITAMFEGAAYKYYDDVTGFLPDHDENVTTLCGLIDSGTTFVTLHNDRIFFTQRPVGLNARPAGTINLGTAINFDPPRRV